MTNLPIDIGKLAEPVSQLVNAVRGACWLADELTHVRCMAHAEGDAALIRGESDLEVEYVQTSGTR
jgi:hypothetical protein